jgi:hypothetical protein
LWLLVLVFFVGEVTPVPLFGRLLVVVFFLFALLILIFTGF